MAAQRDGFAITYTVKNEAALLPEAVDYHFALGCERIYVFFDGTTDSTRELMAGRCGIECAESVDPGHSPDLPNWARQLLPRWGESMDVRKRINTLIAARKAKQSGIQWLINIDPDELLLLGNPSECGADAAAEFFAAIPAGVDQVLVQNLEALPTGIGSGRPFVDCTLFLARYPVTEAVWRATRGALRRILRSPRLQAWYDYWFYHVRFRAALPRLMHHPATGEAIPVGYFLGYLNHKAFIRTAVAEEFLFNIHRWERFGRAPRSIRRGTLLHYDLCSPEYFCSKFRQRQPAMLVRAFFARYMFATIARELSDAEVRRFFLSNLCITDPQILSRLRRRGIVREIDSIARWMERRISVPNGIAPASG